jgi:hypothetical protein
VDFVKLSVSQLGVRLDSTFFSEAVAGEVSTKEVLQGHDSLCSFTGRT